MQNYEVLENDGNSVRVRLPSGEEFLGELGGCGEAFYVNDADGNEITAIPTDRISYISESDIALAARIITQLREGEARLKAQKEAAQKAVVSAEDARAALAAGQSGVNVTINVIVLADKIVL